MQWINWESADHALVILLNREMHVQVNMQKAGRKKKRQMLKSWAERLGDP